MDVVFLDGLISFFNLTYRFTSLMELSIERDPNPSISGGVIEHINEVSEPWQREAIRRYDSWMRKERRRRRLDAAIEYQQLPHTMGRDRVSTDVAQSWREGKCECQNKKDHLRHLLWLQAKSRHEAEYRQQQRMKKQLHIDLYKAACTYNYSEVRAEYLKHSSTDQDDINLQPDIKPKKVPCYQSRLKVAETHSSELRRHRVSLLKKIRDHEQEELVGRNNYILYPRSRELCVSDDCTFPSLCSDSRLELTQPFSLRRSEAELSLTQALPLYNTPQNRSRSSYPHWHQLQPLKSKRPFLLASDIADVRSKTPHPVALV